MNEKTFFEYEDVKVTNTRFITGAQTYAMSNVTSVKNRVDKPSRVLPVVLFLFGLAVFFKSSFGWGVVLCAIAGLWFYLRKPRIT